MQREWVFSAAWHWINISGSAWSPRCVCYEGSYYILLLDCAESEWASARATLNMSSMQNKSTLIKFCCLTMGKLALHPADFDELVSDKLT